MIKSDLAWLLIVAIVLLAIDVQPQWKGLTIVGLTIILGNLIGILNLWSDVKKNWRGK